MKIRKVILLSKRFNSAQFYLNIQNFRKTSKNAGWLKWRTLPSFTIKSEMPLRPRTRKWIKCSILKSLRWTQKTEFGQAGASAPLSAQNPRCHFRGKGNSLGREGLCAMAAFGWRHVGRSRPAQASKEQVSIWPRLLWGSYHPRTLKPSRPEDKGAVAEIGPISRKPPPHR